MTPMTPPVAVQPHRPAALRTERDVAEALAGGTITLAELYAACEQAGVTARGSGHDPIPTHPTDCRWRRRARNALQALKRSGRAHRVGPASWVIDGPTERPHRALLVLVDGTLGDLELVLADAAQLLGSIDEPVDLVVADPPYGLRRDDPDAPGRSAYRRDPTKVVGGYVDVDPGAYREFTHRWIAQAATALRHGGYLAAITGPQRVGHVQTAAQDAGLTYVNSIVATRPFPLRTTRRFAHAHWVVTLMCTGPLEGSARFFAIPPDLPTAASGVAYPLDVWPDIPKHERPGRLRYDNMLPPPLVRRLVVATTRPGDLVADPFLGGGTTALVCLQTDRRFVGGDVNPQALRFTAARLLVEHLWQPLQLSLPWQPAADSAVADSSRDGQPRT